MGVTKNDSTMKAEAEDVYKRQHVSKESAITIGMYPDMDRDHIINAGNSSLEGAQKLLLNRSLLTDIDQILEEMVYIQFAEVEDFLELMVAAQALPHTDYKRYPTCLLYTSCGKLYYYKKTLEGVRILFYNKGGYSHSARI